MQPRRRSWIRRNRTRGSRVRAAMPRHTDTVGRLDLRSLAHLNTRSSVHPFALSYVYRDARAGGFVVSHDLGMPLRWVGERAR